MWDVLLDLWAGSALLCLFVRAVAVCIVGFVSANAWVFVGAAIQVQAGSGSGSGSRGLAKGATGAKSSGSSRRRRRSSADARRPDGRGAGAERRRDDNTFVHPRPSSLPLSPQSPGRLQQNALSPSIAPTRLTSPSSKEQKISPASLLALYEDIMASDAETILTLQATVRAQQEVILAQRGMMRDLQRLVDAQDLWIEAQMEERG